MLEAFVCNGDIMGVLVWHKNLSVGIEKIDEQHKKLISIINELYDIIANDEDRNNLKKIMDKLNEYIHIHFATEERYFNQYNYPGKIEHTTEHNEFVKKVNEFQQEFIAGAYSLSFQLMDFLQDWLVHHIITIDKKYTDFFIKQGLK